MSSGCGCGNLAENGTVGGDRRRILYFVLTINLLMFGFELAAGLWANSTALLADSLDMLADALVYVVSLWAVSRGFRSRAFAALSNAVLEGLLGLAVLGQVGYHIVTPVTPVGSAIMIVAGIAMTANSVCGTLLLRFRQDDINMRAVWLCTRNDVIGNAGTLVAGTLVFVLGSKWPDLVIGGLLAMVLMRTAVGVGRDAFYRLTRTRATAGAY